MPNSSRTKTPSRHRSATRRVARIGRSGFAGCRRRSGRGARREHVPPLLTALYVYFSGATGHHDIVVGVPILNRSSARFKRMVGLFTDITPALLQLTPETSGADAIKAIARSLRRDHRHQRVPLTEITRRARLHRDGRVQLFDVLLNYQTQAYGAPIDGTPVEFVSLRHGAEQTPLAIEISQYYNERRAREHRLQPDGLPAWRGCALAGRPI